MGMKLEGGEGLKKKLRAISEEVPTKMEAAVIAGALIVQNDAKIRAPYKTGNLRSSIHIAPESSGKDEAIVQVGTDVIYGAAQEFGTATIPPHPYMRPAFDANKAKFKKTVSKALENLA